MTMPELHPSLPGVDLCLGSAGRRNSLAFWGRALALPTGGLIVGSGQFSCTLSWRKDVQQTTGSSHPAGKKDEVEKLWHDFFSNPLQWWDNRSEKINSKYPDFKHKETQRGLWLDGKLTPPWVATKLAAMTPGTVQLDIFSWNTRLARLVKAGQCEKALELFQVFKREGMNPNKFTFVPVLNACASLQAIEEGRHIHLQIIESGFESDAFVGTCLVDMYAKCGKIEDASRVFTKMPTRDVISWNAMIFGYVKYGQEQKALDLYEQMQFEGVDPDPVTFVGLLKGCANMAALKEGNHIHQQILQKGYEFDMFVANSLVYMYAKCGSVDDALRVFNKMTAHDAVTWSAMILGFVKCGQGHKALEMSQKMQQEGVEPDSVTFVGLLNACASIASLEEGRHIHEWIIYNGCESDVFVGNSLIDMYCKCGSIEDARTVFNKMPIRDVVSWNSIIMGYAKCGEGLHGLLLWRQLQQSSVEPNSVTFAGVLIVCTDLLMVEEGKRVHKQVIQSGCESDIIVASRLVVMYAKCGNMGDALRVFEKIPRPDVVSWNAMILGYVKCGQGKQALELFPKMQQAAAEPNRTTFIGVLNACASEAALEEGRNAHGQIIQRGFESDAFITTCLIDMYAKCGSIDEAWRAFTKTSTHNVVTWTAIILGYAKCGEGLKAIELFHQMKLEGVNPNPVTFVGVLNACANALELEEGRLVHKHIIECGFECETFVGNSIIDMYAKCGSIEDARRTFDKMVVRDVVAWNAMIAGYVRCGQGQKALEFFQEMQREKVERSPATFVAVLNACAREAALEDGRCVHEEIIHSGFESNVFVCNSLVDMYAKCGSIEDAWRVFSNMPARDVISWNAMILGYVKCGKSHSAMVLWRQMQREGFSPDPVTFSGVLSACAGTVALEEGRRVHGQIIQSGYQYDVFVGNCLVDMYSKCGSMEDALMVFNDMPSHDVGSWTTLIWGYVNCGQGQKALRLYHQMDRDGVDPNSITFVGVLNACASVGALEEGRHIHEHILLRGFDQDLLVGSCLVDMYAKCGSIDDAQRVFNKMPFHDVVCWTTLLGGYAMHGLPNEALGHFKQMCQEGIEINSVAFVCLLSACTHSGLVEEGLHHFESMSAIHSISATVEHYACLVDLLGRAGHLHEAEDLIKTMPCEPNATIWMSLLGACRIHDNVGMAERIADQVLESDPGNAAGYVLLSNIFATAGKWDSSANVTRCRLEKGLRE